MNAINNARFRKLLGRFDTVSANVQQLHDGESAIVKAFERERPFLVRAYQNCQLAVAARAALDGVLTLVFNGTRVPQLADGQVNNDRNVGWFDERIDGVAPAIGLSCAEVTEGILDSAEVLMAQAEALYQTAFDKICASNQPG